MDCFSDNQKAQFNMNLGFFMYAGYDKYLDGGKTLIQET